MQIYKIWEAKLQKLYSTYSKFCDDVRYIKKEPATEEEIINLEDKLCAPLPACLKHFFLNFSKEIIFYAFLPDNFKLPEEMVDIFSSNFTISVDEVLNAEYIRKEWMDGVFQDQNDPYDKVWHNKLGLMTVGNGDVIAFDLDDKHDNKRIIYLSHDDGEAHGYTLGQDFNDYFTKLLKIGGCGNEDWQITPFIDDKNEGINPDCINAKTYRKLIGYE